MPIGRAEVKPLSVTNVQAASLRLELLHMTLQKGLHVNKRFGPTFGCVFDMVALVVRVYLSLTMLDSRALWLPGGSLPSVPRLLVALV